MVGTRYLYLWRPLGVYIAKLETLSTPDLTYPDIIEWSKPLPPEQWAKRSPELESAIMRREVELAAEAVQL